VVGIRNATVESMIVIHNNLQSEMIADFEREVQELKILLRGREIVPGTHERARSRIHVVEASVEELKKQMRDSARHHALSEGINPESGAEYNEMKQQFLSTFNTI
jgi:hypothetical protein